MKLTALFILSALLLMTGCPDPSIEPLPAPINDASDDVPDMSMDIASDQALDQEIDAPIDMVEPPDMEPSVWRSRFYPTQWQAHTSKALHDFSFAGYQYGEPTPGGQEDIIDVVQRGVANDGQVDVTSTVQQLIDELGQQGGGVLFFPVGQYRFDGQLHIKDDNVVLRGADPHQTQLFFTTLSRNGQNHINFGHTIDLKGPEVLLASDGKNFASTIEVQDASTLSVGQEVAIGWVIGPAFVEAHHMTDVWQAFNDTWQMFFWRKIKAIDTSTTPHRVELDVPLRYDAKTRDLASIRLIEPAIRQCGIESMSLSNATSSQKAHQYRQTHVLGFQGARDCWVRDVHSFASPESSMDDLGYVAHLASGGIIVEESARVTVEQSSMSHPFRRDGGGNGYLFEVRRSSEILFKALTATRGRHNFIQNWGFGTSGCVWTGIHSKEGLAINNGVQQRGNSEFHHSLAMANLIEDSTIDDGWAAVNRHTFSSGAGHTATQNVFWNLRGQGQITSGQFGQGYIIGTSPDLKVLHEHRFYTLFGAQPIDEAEGLGRAQSLEPQSLYLDQRQRRLTD